MYRVCVTLISIIACIAISCGMEPQTAITPSNLSVEFTGEAPNMGERQTTSSNSLDGKSACQVTAIWTVCNDETFKSYTLYRATSPGISQNPAEAQLLGVFENPSINAYVDESVIGSTHYYYTLQTMNVADMPSWSNEVQILTPSGTAPTPSILSDSTDEISSYLWWTPCQDTDFTSYTLFRSNTPGIASDTLSAIILAIYYGPESTSYVDSGFYGISAYYSIRTRNDFGQKSWSNEVCSVLRDSTIVTWGQGDYEVPNPNYGFVDISAGHIFKLGLRDNGSVVAWGSNLYGQCDVPTPNTDFVVICAGNEHSLGLKEDGSIVAWGSNNLGQCDVPTPNIDFVGIAGGKWHSIGLKEEGFIVAWGYNNYGQCDIPTPNSDFIDIVAGYYHNIGLKEDGSIVAWGSNNSGQCDIPSPNTGFVEVAAGERHSLGLKEDGSIVAWGYNNYGQCDVPSPNSGFVAIAAGYNHSLGLRENGSVVAWGQNQYYGQCDVPSPNSCFVAIAAGGDQSMGLKAKGAF